MDSRVPFFFLRRRHVSQCRLVSDTRKHPSDTLRTSGERELVCCFRAGTTRPPPRLIAQPCHFRERTKEREHACRVQRRSAPARRARPIYWYKLVCSSPLQFGWVCSLNKTYFSMTWFIYNSKVNNIARCWLHRSLQPTS